MAPASLNALYSLLLRKDTGMEYTITVTNHPLPSTSEDEVYSHALLLAQPHTQLAIIRTLTASFSSTHMN